MPYLEYLYCEHCGEPHRLDIDDEATIWAYIDEGRTTVSINPATLVFDYLVYKCWKCSSKFVYTFRDVENRVRQYFSAKSKEHHSRIEQIIESRENLDEVVRKIETTVRKRYGKR